MSIFRSFSGRPGTKISHAQLTPAKLEVHSFFWIPRSSRGMTMKGRRLDVLAAQKGLQKT